MCVPKSKRRMGGPGMPSAPEEHDQREFVMDIGASVSSVSGDTRARAVVSIVLGSYNRKEFLNEAIQSIRRNGITVPYEIIVVDGGSTDGALEWLTRQQDVITI